MRTIDAGGNKCVTQVKEATKAGSPSLSNDTLLIKNNTKQGYLEARDGDGVYTNVSNKRGTVQKDMIQTLTTFQDKGVVISAKN